MSNFIHLWGIIMAFKLLFTPLCSLKRGCQVVKLPHDQDPVYYLCKTTTQQQSDLYSETWSGILLLLAPVWSNPSTCFAIHQQNITALSGFYHPLSETLTHLFHWQSILVRIFSDPVGLSWPLGQHTALLQATIFCLPYVLLHCLCQYSLKELHRPFYSSSKH